jgi:hypothetical protein
MQVSRNSRSLDSGRVCRRQPGLPEPCGIEDSHGAKAFAHAENSRMEAIAHRFTGYWIPLSAGVPG